MISADLLRLPGLWIRTHLFGTGEKETAADAAYNRILVRRSLTQLGVPCAPVEGKNALIWSLGRNNLPGLDMHGIADVSEGRLFLSGINRNLVIENLELSEALRWANDWNLNHFSPKVHIDPFVSMFVAEWSGSPGKKPDLAYIRETLLRRAFADIIKFHTEAEKKFRKVS